MGFLGALQGINISHLGKRKIIFKMPFLGDMLVSWRVNWRPCSFKKGGICKTQTNATFCPEKIASRLIIRGFFKDRDG